MYTIFLPCKKSSIKIYFYAGRWRNCVVIKCLASMYMKCFPDSQSNSLKNLSGEIWRAYN